MGSGGTAENTRSQTLIGLLQRHQGDDDVRVARDDRRARQADGACRTTPAGGQRGGEPHLGNPRVSMKSAVSIFSVYPALAPE